MDAVQIFNDELQSLLDTKPPVSKAKMGLITRAAMKGVKFYKHIVLCVEKFIAKCRSEYKVPGLYVIDSIVRQSRHQFGIERDVYAVRFSRNLQMTFENLFTGCLPEDRSKIVRVLNLWQKNGVFSSQTIQPLLNMAGGDSGSSMDQTNFSATSPPSHENNSKPGQTSSYHYDASSGRHQKVNESGLKFSKNMLDFDYDEDDDDDNGDETPTEAEPPLSSTLNKIEMEQRGHQRNNGGNTTYHSSQVQHHNSHYQPDPVLERWNRIIRGESSNDVSDSRTKRSRSRSPPQPSTLLQSSANPKYVLESSTNFRDFVYKPPAQTKIDIIQTHQKQITAIDPERAAEREKKCLPKIRDKHLTVCSSTLWLGHVPKTVSEADLSDAFGEYGTITSIDLIPPRGCAYVCMDRRQDAKRALNESKDLKLNGSHIKMAWAPGKGFKEYKQLKEFWEVETGSSYIPYSKIDETIDFSILEEGGVIDEDSMSIEMRERRERRQKAKEQEKAQNGIKQNSNLPMPALPLMSQPPPPTSIAPFNIPPPSMNIPPPSMNIPPPSALTQGMIHFPPPSVPIVTSTASGPVAASSALRTEEPNDTENGDGSPSSIDQQLNMTERQINMVEQQLNMIKQAQNMGGPHTISQANAIPPMHPPPIFHPQTQPNPMIFDVPLQPHIVPAGQPILDPSIFVNPAHLLLPISQANMIDPTNLLNTMMQNQQGRF